MADWTKPTLTSTYTNFLTEVTGRDTDLAVGLDPAVVTVTSPPTNAIRWNSANNRWEKWNGSSWGTLSSLYALTGLSTTGNATIGGTLTVTGASTLTAVTATTPSTSDNSTNVATTAYVRAQNYAPLASPTLTGTPAAPTAAVNTNTTQLATCAFVLGQGNSTAATVAMNGTQAAGTSTLWARADHVHPSDTSRAPLASPTFTGTPTAPTAAVDTNTTQLATTAFVVGQSYLKSATAASTYLTQANAASTYLTPASAASTFAPLSSPTFTGTVTAPKIDLSANYVQAIVAVSALNIDCSLGNFFTKTISSNSTFTVSNVPASRAYAFTLEVTHTTGTITWFSGVNWPNGQPPVLLTGKTHLFFFVTDNGGTTWRGSSQTNYAA